MIIAEELWSDAAIERETLTWVNTVRGERGMPRIDALPYGIVDAVEACVIARALPGISGEIFGPNLEQDVVEPPAVLEFIYRFDDGNYPHLIDTTNAWLEAEPEEELVCS